MVPLTIWTCDNVVHLSWWIYLGQFYAETPLV